MLAHVHSGALLGVEALPVHVEVNTGQIGDLRLILVGLPDAAVKESQDRVFSALANCGFQIPETRTTINLAPGNIRKEGPAYDLPIALGILAATGQMRTDALKDFVIAGELSLSGATRPIKGGLALALLAKKQQKKGVLLPKESALEASLVEGIAVYPIESVRQAANFLLGTITLSPLSTNLAKEEFSDPEAYTEDFSEIKGQMGLRRAIEVAVAGGHNVLIIGPPGAGKSMIASRIPTIMPQPTQAEFLDILSIRSAAGMTLGSEAIRFKRPFRSPHHTISDVGLLGGGSIPGPGEISLAHNGVLFMDELPEFKRATLEVLRQPLEEGFVSIARSAAKVTFPASVMLVAAMNPCPCGYLGDPKRSCRCSAEQVRRYRNRLSGPLLDRIDIHIEVPPVSVSQLRSKEPGESSAAISKRIKEARDRQYARCGVCNDNLNPKQIEQHCGLSHEQGNVLQKAIEKLHLSARAYTRILKVARTIADLQGASDIETTHLMEAIQYRTLDRTIFQ